MAKSRIDQFASTKLGGIFFKNDDGQVSERDAEEEQSTRSVQSRTVTPATFGAGAATSVAPPSFSTSYVMPLNADLETVAKIKSLAEGTDQKSYSRFLDIKRGISENGVTDEASLYRTAFVAAKAIGLPGSEILRGLDTILATLSGAEQRIKTEAPQRINAKVGARRQKISEIQQGIAARNSEMQRLQAEIDRLRGETGNLSNAEQAEQTAIAQDEQTVRADVEKFSTALEVVRAPYLAERQKIELYGKGA